MPFLATTAFWIAVAKWVLVTAISSLLSAALAPGQKAGRTNEALKRSRDVNFRGTVDFAQIIYGQVQTAGHISYMGIGDADSDLLYVVVVVAGHQVEAITDCWLDDRLVPDASINPTTGLVTTGSFKDKDNNSFLKIFKHLGTHDQAVDATLTAAIKEWDDTHTGAGLAYLVYVLDYSDEVWPGGMPGAFMHLVSGKRVYDARLDSTNGGSGSHRYDDATTWEFSRNPALIARDYITGGSVYFSTATPINIFGIGEPNARMLDTYGIAAANVCDQGVDIPILLNATADLDLSGTGLTRTITKASTAIPGWNSYAYIPEPLESIDLTITLANISSNIYVGLSKYPATNSDPTSKNRTSLSSHYFAYVQALSHISIVDSDSFFGSTWAYTVGVTTLRITYDGATVTYYVNGSSVHTIADSGGLYVHTFMYEIGASTTIMLTDLTQKRYTCDTQLSCGDIHQQNMSLITSAMLGRVSYVNGKYLIYAGAYDTPTITISADDVLSEMELSTHPSGDQVYNYVTGTFYDEDRGWKLNTFPARTQLVYQDDDGGLFTRNIDLHATRGNARAQRIANIILEQSRNKVNIHFSGLSPKAINIGQWETFYVTLPEYGYSLQPFRCLEWRFLQTGLIEMTAQIESAAAYADLDLTAYIDPPTDRPATAQVQQPQTPTGLTLTGFPTYIKAIVALPSDLRTDEIVEIWEHTSSSPFSSATKIDEGNKTVFQIPKRDTTTRYYWTRVRANGIWSNTYPSSTGTAGVADIVQSVDVAFNAITDNYANTVNFSGGSSAPGTTTFINSITFTSSVDATVSIYGTIDATSTLDADSGSFAALYLDETSDVSSGVPGGSAVYGNGISISSVRATAAMNYDFSVVASTNYTIGMVARKLFGTFTIYATQITVVVKKR